MNPPSLPWSTIDSYYGNFTSPVNTLLRLCPICGSLYHQTIFCLDNFQFFTDSTALPKRSDIRVQQCTDCHAVFQNPCYSELGFKHLFAEAGLSYGAAEGRPQEQVDWLTQRGLLSEGMTCLDIGCYDGRFLGTLPAHLRRIGVDIDQPAISRGRKQYAQRGVEFLLGAFDNFACPTQPDVIFMFHVLEHLANPYQVLRHLSLISHPCTRLVIEVPVLEYGKTNDINGFFSVQHMTHFSTNSLMTLLRRAGWGVLESMKIPGYNGFRLLAQPSSTGVGTKNGLADIRHVYSYLADWHQNVHSIAARMEQWPCSEKVIIWGGGMHTEFLYHLTPLFRQRRERQFLIVDSDPLKQGKTWRGIPILTPASIAGYTWENTLLVISSYGKQEAIANAAAGLGVMESAIMRLYDHVNAY